MPLHQDPVLGYRVGTPYASRVYDAAPAPKNKVSLQGPLTKVYSLSNIYEIKYVKWDWKLQTWVPYV